MSALLAVIIAGMVTATVVIVPVWADQRHHQLRILTATHLATAWLLLAGIVIGLILVVCEVVR